MIIADIGEFKIFQWSFVTEHFIVFQRKVEWTENVQLYVTDFHAINLTSSGAWDSCCLHQLFWKIEKRKMIWFTAIVKKTWLIITINAINFSRSHETKVNQQFTTEWDSWANTRKEQNKTFMMFSFLLASTIDPNLWCWVEHENHRVVQLIVEEWWKTCLN